LTAILVASPTSVLASVSPILVAAFVALYPYLEGMDSCMVGECPYAAQSSHGGSTDSVATYVSAVLAASVTLFF
jgi:hypothetical protein